MADESARDPSTHADDQAETRRHLKGYLQAYAGLRGRVCRILLLHLHKQGKVAYRGCLPPRANGPRSEFVPHRPQPPLGHGSGRADEKEIINGIVIELAAEHLTPEEVDDIVWAAHRRDEAQSLRDARAHAGRADGSHRSRRSAQYVSMIGNSVEQGRPTRPKGTIVALLRRFISNRVDYISVAKR